MSFPSTRSPSEKGRELPFAIADATADFKKSMFDCAENRALLSYKNECRAATVFPSSVQPEEVARRAIVNSPNNPTDVCDL